MILLGFRLIWAIRQRLAAKKVAGT